MSFAFILNDRKATIVPGTVILDDEQTHSTAAAYLKHGSGGNSHVVLVPQPSDNHDDPLNWPMSKKLASFLATLFGTCLYAGCMSPLLNAGLLVVAGELDVGIGQVALMAGEQMLVVAVSSPFVLALSRKYGKRPIYLVSSLLSVIGTAVCQTANTYSHLRAGRIIQGFSCTAYESIILASIGDLFFVHERGAYIAATNFMFAGISSLVSVVSGPIVNYLGWRYLLHIYQAFTAAQLILQFFLSPETSYRRETSTSHNAVTEIAAAELRHDDTEDPKDPSVTTATHHESASVRPRKTFREGLALWNGVFTDENFLQLFIATFAVLLNLAVFFVAILQAFYASLLVSLAISVAQLFGLPPYNLSPASIGYLSLGPFIGACIGLVVFGVIQDPLVKCLSRRNRGVYEPEYRLLIGIPSVVTGVGVILFGYLSGNQESYYACSAVYGLAIFGVIGCLATTSSYILDAYYDMTGEIFIISNAIKNLVFYGVSSSVNGWIMREGPQSVFFTLGGIALGLLLGLPVLYVFGKRYRAVWARHNLLTKFHIRTHVV